MIGKKKLAQPTQTATRKKNSFIRDLAIPSIPPNHCKAGFFPPLAEIGQAKFVS
jgi:hypothetical protein